MKDKVVIYHSGCRDGFTAAWAAWLKLGDEAEYIPGNYGQKPPDVTGKEVYILDFSYPRPVLEDMHEKAKSLLVLDHHDTVQKALAGLPYAVFDMNRSGAMMAWDHFHPGVKPPLLVQYVQDRDLWTWKLPFGKSISLAVYVTPMEMESWTKLMTRMETDLQGVVTEGEAMLQLQLAEVDRLRRNARVVNRFGFSVAVLNTASFASEVLSALAKEHTFAMGWMEGRNGMRLFSLRSTGFHVGRVAEAFGGGGHRKAAGFNLPAFVRHDTLAVADQALRAANKVDLDERRASRNERT